MLFKAFEIIESFSVNDDFSNPFGLPGVEIKFCICSEFKELIKLPNLNLFELY